MPSAPYHEYVVLVTFRARDLAGVRMFAMCHRVIHVLGSAAIAEVRYCAVGRVSIQMTYLKSFGSRPKEHESNQAM